MPENIEITIRKKPKKSSISGRRRRGPIIPKNKKKYLPRRLQGGVNFWDLGQILNDGIYVDNEFFSDLAWVIENGDLQIFVEDFWNYSYDFIFENSIESWESLHRPFKYDDAYKYGIEFYRDFTFTNFERLEASNPNWTSTGLKLTGTEFVINSPSGTFISFSNDPTYCKITAVNDYLATSVDFSLQNGDNVFLIPYPMCLVAHSREEVGTIPYLSQMRVTPHHYISREFFLDKVDSISGRPILEHFEGVLSSQDFSAYSLKFVELLAGGGVTQFNYAGLGDVVTVDFSFDTFPRYPVEQKFLHNLFSFNQTGSGTAWSSALVPITATPPEGTLAGVIKRGSQFFYFWLVSSFPIFHGQILTK